MNKSNLDTPEIVAFIKSGRDVYTNAELAELIRQKFSVETTPLKIKAFRSNHKLCGTGKIKFRRGASEAVFTMEQKHAIAWLCTTHNDSELAFLFERKFGVNRTPQQFKTFRHNSGIKTGRTGYFHTEENPRSYIPKKGEHFSPATEFKKGARPANWLPIGSERITKDGYRIVKVSDTGSQWQRWKFKNRLVWEAAHGKIPHGCNVIHIDGNPLNDNLENLRLVDDSTLLQIIRAGGLDMPLPKLNNAKISICEIETKLRSFK